MALNGYLFSEKSQKFAQRRGICLEMQQFMPNKYFSMQTNFSMEIKYSPLQNPGWASAQIFILVILLQIVIKIETQTTNLHVFYFSFWYVFLVVNL